jgi:hypothetical protein
MRDIKFLESAIGALEQENEVSSLRFQLEESDNANRAIGDTINKTLESFIMETMLSDKEPIGDA